MIVSQLLQCCCAAEINMTHECQLKNSQEIIIHFRIHSIVQYYLRSVKKCSSGDFRSEHFCFGCNNISDKLKQVKKIISVPNHSIGEHSNPSTSAFCNTWYDVTKVVHMQSCLGLKDCARDPICIRTFLIAHQCLPII